MSTRVRQPRGRRSNVEDLWLDRRGNHTKRYGRGKRWRIRYVDAEGAEHTEAFDRKTVAASALEEITSKIVTGTYVAPAAGAVTVAEMHRQWSGEQGHVSEGTRATRTSAWRTHVRPRWEKVAVRDVQRSAVRSWVASMRDGGAGPETIENALGVLRMVLDTAVDNRRIAVNPCVGVKTPARQHKARAYLTHEQVWELAGAMDARYSALVLFLAYTGLRFGEAAGLQVQGADLLRRRIEVRRSITETEGRLVISPTKGKHRRTVPVPRFLVEPLSVLMQGKGREDLVFEAPKGGTLRLTSWRRRFWGPALDTLREIDDEGVAHADWPAATPHDLRHTAASLAISAGANVKAVQTMLGHKSAALTLDTYADLFPSDLESVSTAFDAAVATLGRGASESPQTAE